MVHHNSFAGRTPFEGEYLTRDALLGQPNAGLLPRLQALKAEPLLGGAQRGVGRFVEPLSVNPQRTPTRNQPQSTQPTEWGERPTEGPGAGLQLHCNRHRARLRSHAHRR